MDLSERRGNYIKNETMAEDIVNGMTGENDKGETCNNNESEGEKVKKNGLERTVKKLLSAVHS